MEENDILIIREFKLLRCTLFNHLWVFPIIIIINILILLKMYFLYKVYMAFFIICTIIYFLEVLIIYYPLYLFKKGLFRKKAKLILKISFINMFIIIVLSIIINLMTFLNIHSLFSFYKECPYNFSYNDISKIFGIKYNEDNIKNIEYSYSKKCTDNRCILINEELDNQTFFSYLCNFDSSNDFQSFNDKLAKTFFFAKIKANKSEIYCKDFDENDFDNQDILNEKKENFYIIKSYFKICSYETKFYECYRDKRPKKYKIKYDFSCPNIYDNILSITLGVISFIFNFVASLIIIIFEYLKCRKIVKLLDNIIPHPEGASTRGNTKSSVIFKSNDNQSNNKDNNTNEIQSQTIIIEGHSRKKEEIEEIQINNINVINNDGLITINRLNNEDIKKGIQFNELGNSDRKKLNLMNFNDLKDKNETADNYNTGNNSIIFHNINLEKNKENEK